MMGRGAVVTRGNGTGGGGRGTAAPNQSYRWTPVGNG